MNASTIKANVDGQNAMDVSTELTAMWVPVGLAQNVKEMVGVYQAERRKDPQYIHALSNALKSPIGWDDDDDLVIDKAQKTVCFAYLDELIAVFKDELTFPKNLVKFLVETYGEMVDIYADEPFSDDTDREACEDFHSEFHARVSQLLGMRLRH
ncbi:MAG: hypothetical protein ACKOF9_02670 [Burkholderiales bacterium]